MPDRYPTRRPFCCRSCGTVLGSRVTEGLVVDKVLMLPRQAFVCKGCRTPYKNVSIAFAGADAQENGLASVMKTQPGQDQIPPPGMDWELLKEMHQAGQLQIFKNGAAVVILATPKEEPIKKAADSIINNVLGNENISVEQKRHLLLASLQSLEQPEEAHEEAHEEAYESTQNGTVEQVSETATATTVTAAVEAAPTPEAAVETESPTEGSFTPMTPREPLPEGVRPMEDEDPVGVGSRKRRR